MTEIPSTRFRASFHRLTEPTVVTVNGHAIGTWLPGRVGPWPFAPEVSGTVTPADGQPVGFAGPSAEVIADLSDRVLAKDEEIARLKRELALPDGSPKIRDPLLDAKGNIVASSAELNAAFARLGDDRFGTPHAAPKTRKAR